MSVDHDNELNLPSFLKILEHCIADIRLWMIQNFLIWRTLGEERTPISPHSK